MSEVKPVTDLKRAAPNNVTPASSSEADDFSLCGDGVVIKPLPTELSSGEVKLAEKPVVEKPVVEKPVVEKPVVEKPVVEKPVVEKPAPVPTPKTPVEKPAPKPSPAKEKELPKVTEKEEKPIESPIAEEDEEEETPEKPKADSVKSGKSGSAKKVDAAPVETVTVEKELKDSEPVVEIKKEEKKIETVKKELKKDAPVEKPVKTTKLLGSMKKVSFGDSTFCLGFAEKDGNTNFYAKCELEEGKCPTEFNPLTCTLAPIHLSDVLHKAVLTKL